MEVTKERGGDFRLLIVVAAEVGGGWSGRTKRPDGEVAEADVDVTTECVEEARLLPPLLLLLTLRGTRENVLSACSATRFRRRELGRGAA